MSIVGRSMIAWCALGGDPYPTIFHFHGADSRLLDARSWLCTLRGRKRSYFYAEVVQLLIDRFIDLLIELLPVYPEIGDYVEYERC